ncbi:uncharacterized protein LOC131613854 [Vicia villosa]|uniref:uncharacterized protein LOC131613854 n=1 Tax=Vicia villosa TaxID=3911 RepID=UPI00273B07CE|nr:uncharacterized protein LOC131613854 [Vicia villosa]
MAATTPCANSPHLNPQFARTAANGRTSELKTGTTCVAQADEETLFKRLFPHSMLLKAKDWYLDQPEVVMTDWNTLEEKFLERFYSQNRFFDAKTTTAVFSQGSNESLNEAWERYKAMLRKCKGHDFAEVDQIHMFHNGLTPTNKTLLDATTGGSLMSKTPAEATQIIERMALNDRQGNHDRTVRDKKPGLLELTNSDALLAQNKLLTSQNQNPNHPPYQQGYPPRNNNQGYQQRPNNQGYQQQTFQPYTQPPPQQQGGPSKLEETMTQFMQMSMTNQKNQDAAIKNLETQVGQLAKQIAANQSNATFSANTQENPKEDCKAVVTRTGQKGDSEEVENNDIEKEDDNRVAEDEENEIVERDEQRGTKKIITAARCQTGEARCAIVSRLPQKAKDPGRVTLPVTIGNQHIGNGLIDLGSSINLIPLSIVKRLGNIDMKSTRMTLQLADKSTTLPHGVAQDMLIKVDKFLFPVDFVVIDMEEDKE